MIGVEAVKNPILGVKRCWKGSELGSKGGHQHLKHLVNMYVPLCSPLSYKDKKISFMDKDQLDFWFWFWECIHSSGYLP